MRFTDFRSITEAKVAKDRWAIDYKGDYNNKAQKVIANGGPLIVHINKQKTDVFFNDDQKQPAIDILKNYDMTQATPTMTGSLENGEEVSFLITNVEKEFNLPGADGETVKAVRVNMGDVAEGITGFACAARFANTSDADITEADIISIGKKFFAGQTEVPVKDRTDDKLKIVVDMPGGSYEALKMLIETDGDFAAVAKAMGLTAAAKTKLKKMIPDASKYASEGKEIRNAVEKIKEYYQDTYKQTISILSEGGDSEKQSSTKVDLSVEIAPQSDEAEWETITVSLLSLKAGGGASQVGQVSGYAFGKLELFWRSSFNFSIDSSFKPAFSEVIEPAGRLQPNTKDPSKMTWIWNSKPEREAAMERLIQGPIRKTFDEAKRIIDKQIAGDLTDAEAEFYISMQKGLLYHTSKVEKEGDVRSKVQGDEDVTVLIMNPGGGKSFVELKFGEPFREMLEYFDLYSSEVEEADGGKGVYLRIKAKKKNQPDMPEQIKNLKLPDSDTDFIAQYRSALKSGSIRNTVEIGTQAKTLANVVNFLEKQEDAADAADRTDAAPQEPQQAPKKTNDPNATI
jgi:hypothetical protein